MANPFQDIAARAEYIASPVYRNGTITPPLLRTAAEGRAFISQIVQIQKHLRLFRADVVNQIKVVRNAHKKGRAGMRPNIAVAVTLGPGKSKELRARSREADRQAEQQLLAPYEQGLAYIDRLLVLLDETKLSINQWAMDPRIPRK